MVANSDVMNRQLYVIFDGDTSAEKLQSLPNIHYFYMCYVEKQL